MPEKEKEGAAPEVETSEDRFEHEIEDLEAPGWKKNKTQIWVGAALVVIVLALIYVVTQMEAKPKKTAGPVILPIEMLEPRPGTLANTPTKFRWEGVSGTKYYAFRIFGKDAGTPLIERAASGPSVTLTPEETQRITKGGSYEWEVTALSDLGKQLAQGRGSFKL